MAIIEIMIFVFLFLSIFMIFIGPWIWKKLAKEHGKEKLNKIILKIGLFFVFSAILFLIIGYLSNYTPHESYENGYLYVDEVALTASIILMIGLFCIVWWAGNKIKKFAHDRGYTVESQ